MSKVGCLCIKYTYLRELYVRYRSAKGTSNVEKCAHEKRWLDVVAKNGGRVNQRACGLNENDYLLRWYDEDYWRMEYYNFIRQHEQALDGFGADNIWTFDVIQFPYNTSTHLLRAPEKDYERRPRNSKPRVSVIFAFNAAGDYIQPYFIYPLNLKTANNSKSNPTDSQSDDAVPAPTETTTKEEPISESQGNECFAPNGFVTCRVFEEWLTKSYVPYLKQLQVDKRKNSGETAQATNVLVFCGKLAVIDAANMKLCRDEHVSLFNMTHESQMPFNLLFQKSLRNRQTDLFLDSWRKITTKLNLSYQMKCKSRQDFFNLFTDTFQNCIEEIGNREEVKVAPQQTTEMDVLASALNQSFSSQSVVEFKNKMVSSFQQCLLWPLNEEEYSNHLTKGQAILDKSKSSNMAENVIPEETEMEVDDNLLKDSTNLNKEEGDSKTARGKKGRKSVSISETSENINSMKVQVNASDCETTEDLTADDGDETMGDDTLDSNLDELEGAALEESQSSEDEDLMASKSKRQRKSTKANEKTKVTKTTPLERKESKKAGKTHIKELETSIKKVLNGQIKDFGTASAVINDLVSQNKEISLTDLVNDLLHVILKPNTSESNSGRKNRANNSWLNDPFEQRINSKIEAFAATASTSKLFLESLFNDISNDICCLSATDKKTMYMKDLSSSICSFYLNRSHEKLRV